MKTEDKTPLTDLEIKGIITIIDAASTRGAFKAKDLYGVGSIVNRLTALVEPQTQTIIQTGDKDEKNNGSNNQ